jgi:hypothetical protein
MPKESDRLIVISRAYDLARAMTDVVRRFPRDLRVTLGDRLLLTTYGILETLIEARYTTARGPLLRQANLGIERARFLLRLATDTRAVSLGQYAVLAEQLVEVGRLVGGWTKRVNGPTLEPPGFTSGGGRP